MLNKFPNLQNEKLIALDLETYDPDIKTIGCRSPKSYILGVSISTKDKDWYFPLRHRHEENCNEENFFNWLRDLSNISIVGANILYDLDFLQYTGYKPQKNIFDVQFAEPLIDENRGSYSLDALGKIYFNIGKEKSEIENFCEENKLRGDARKHLYLMPSHIVGKYAKKDTRLTYDIFEKQIPILKEQELWNVFSMECSLLPLLLQMKEIGVRIDERKLITLQTKYEKKLAGAKKELHNITGFDVNVYATESIKMAWEKMGYPFVYTQKGNPSFSHYVLENHGSELAKKITEVRKYEKVYNDYIIGIRRFITNGRIHASFHPLRNDNFGTVSGRFSSSNPNLQQMPSRDPEIKKDIRGLFIPEKGHSWVKGDYSQIEYRIFAHYARGKGSDELREAYRNDPTIDFHQRLADIIGESRTMAKTINFGAIYGMGIAKLCKSLNISEEEGRSILNGYYNRFPFLKYTLNTASNVAKRRGYVKTIMGRRRRFKDKQFCYRALNSIVQGSAADLLKAAMVATYEQGIFKILKPHITVHDEMDCSMPNTKEGEEALCEMKNIFENVIGFKVPIIFDIDIMKNNWGEK